MVGVGARVDIAVDDAGVGIEASVTGVVAAADVAVVAGVGVDPKVTLAGKAGAEDIKGAVVAAVGRGAAVGEGAAVPVVALDGAALFLVTVVDVAGVEATTSILLARNDVNALGGPAVVDTPRTKRKCGFVK